MFAQRLRLSGSYFDLTDRFVKSATGKSATGESAALEPNGPDTGEHRIVISVAKRLVASAVRRNTVRRIVRESWRAALQSSQSTPFRMKTGSAHEDDEDSAPAHVCLVRLKRYPGGVMKSTLGLATIKRQLRADADALFAAFLQGRPLRPCAVDVMNRS